MSAALSVALERSGMRFFYNTLLRRSAKWRIDSARNKSKAYRARSRNIQVMDGDFLTISHYKLLTDQLLKE